MTVKIPNSQLQDGFNIHELTDGTLGGTGVFDVLMDSVKAHLWHEYDKQRIRGTDYANAYIRLAEVAMQVSTDYAMRKAKLGAELTLLQKEADKIDKDMGHMDYQSALVQAQTKQVIQETTNLSTKLPKEIALMEKEVLLKTEQVNLTKEEVLLKKSQVPIMTEELKVKQAEVRIAEGELAIKQAQLPLTQAQTAQVQEQTKAITQQIKNDIEQAKLVTAQTENLTAKTPKEVELLTAQASLVTKQAATESQQAGIAQKELDIKTKQVELAEYDLRNIKPEELRLKQAELAQVNAQKDLYAQKVITERAQTDPAVIKPDSHIDKNNQVLTAQAKSYNDDSKIKMASIMADVWKVAHSTDANGMRPTTDSFTGAANIKQVLERTANSVGT